MNVTVNETFQCPVCPTVVQSPMYVIGDSNAYHFALALAVTGLGIVLGLFSVVIVIMLLVRRLNKVMYLLRRDVLSGFAPNHKIEKEHETSCSDCDEY